MIKAAGINILARDLVLVIVLVGNAWRFMVLIVI